MASEAKLVTKLELDGKNFTAGIDGAKAQVTSFSGHSESQSGKLRDMAKIMKGLHSASAEGATGLMGIFKVMKGAEHLFGGVVMKLSAVGVALAAGWKAGSWLQEKLWDKFVEGAVKGEQSVGSIKQRLEELGKAQKQLDKDAMTGVKQTYAAILQYTKDIVKNIDMMHSREASVKGAQHAVEKTQLETRMSGATPEEKARALAELEHRQAMETQQDAERRNVAVIKELTDEKMRLQDELSEGEQELAEKTKRFEEAKIAAIEVGAREGAILRARMLQEEMNAAKSRVDEMRKTHIDKITDLGREIFEEDTKRQKSMADVANIELTKQKKIAEIDEDGRKAGEKEEAYQDALVAKNLEDAEKEQKEYEKRKGKIIVDAASEVEKINEEGDIKEHTIKSSQATMKGMWQGERDRLGVAVKTHQEVKDSKVAEILSRMEQKLAELTPP